MIRGDKKYDAYVQILKEELVPAMGCTEPIALAYAAAKAREILGCMPTRVLIEASGSIIKNVKSVIVPNTKLKELDGKFGYEYQQAYDADSSVVRFCTSWATTEENVKKLLEAMK